MTGRQTVEPLSPAVHASLVQHQAAIAQLQRIAAQSYDTLFLADGPPQPDYVLLDHCASALHELKLADEILKKWQNLPPGDHKRISGLYEQAHAHKSEARRLMRAIGGIKATTAAGIYAKAMLVRHAETAAVLAASLALDFLDCEPLRASIWPAEQPG